MANKYHIPVLLGEAVDGLAIKPGGVYVDATYGGGGHSSRILEYLDQGHLIAFDQDVDAKENLPVDKRLIFVQHNFRYIKNFLHYYGFEKVDGILADLGVSSHDFDMPHRGFSFRFDGDLDMRMNQTGKLTAAHVINEYEEFHLTSILREYGELPNAKKTASVIVNARQDKPIDTTGRLHEVLTPVMPKKAAAKYMAKVFQAIRIEVNRELEVLRDFLADSADVLKKDGRLVVISYHSLEDRLVKNFIQRGGFDKEIETDFFGNRNLIFKPVGEKLIVPSENEIMANPRARSAKLRIAKRL
ncbi:MAG: 16S rRNA (cytosine(1402)-N(4))-methyltransferase RsmH [Prolixibacteraceae bacterium]|nr:16S rRNA (cytosine(1402)-N(4))-methyltransferase RsmH [Prolixibacteraceae bacterium]